MQSPIRKGDRFEHDGEVTCGSPRAEFMGSSLARKGDEATCALHGQTFIVGAPTSFPIATTSGYMEQGLVAMQRPQWQRPWHRGRVDELVTIPMRLLPVILEAGGRVVIEMAEDDHRVLRRLGRG